MNKKKLVKTRDNRKNTLEAMANCNDCNKCTNCSGGGSFQVIEQANRSVIFRNS